MVEGEVQKEGEVIHIIARRCFNYSKLLQHLNSVKSDHLNLKPMSRSDETSTPYSSPKSKQENEIIQGKIFPDGRNFK
jgi:error-prone DNA polymerase